MKSHSLLFSAPMARAMIAGSKSQTRRLPGRHNTVVDGRRASPALWARLDWQAPSIFVDHGPSPAGNAGPYLHVPEKE